MVGGLSDIGKYCVCSIGNLQYSQNTSPKSSHIGRLLIWFVVWFIAHLQPRAWCNSAKPTSEDNRILWNWALDTLKLSPGYCETELRILWNWAQDTLKLSLGYSEAKPRMLWNWDQKTLEFDKPVHYFVDNLSMFGTVSNYWWWYCCKSIQSQPVTVWQCFDNHLLAFGVLSLWGQCE